MLGDLEEILQHSVTRDVMRQRCEAEIWFTPSFHCYLLKFRCHGRPIFSLHRRPCFLLHGAHVTQEQFNYRDRFPMWPALPTSEYYQSDDFHPVIVPSSLVACQVLQARA